MRYENLESPVLATAATLLGAAAALADDKPAVGNRAVDAAFESLKTFDFGKDVNSLAPIDAAVIASHGDAEVRKALEVRLAAVLKTNAPRGAKDYVCRKLTVIGTAECVPTVAALLPDKDYSHLGRYALERIPAPEAAQALRDALGKVDGKLKIGVIGSLGVRRDEASTAALAGLLADAAVATAAAAALGDIGTADAAKALGAAKPADAVKPAVADATLTCAERLLADGKKAEAISVYKSLSGSEQSKEVRLAATRGLLAAAGKKD